MEIYLIRHTSPDVEAGTCYGQTDLATTESLEQEAKMIAGNLSVSIQHVISSPLQRCKKLAEYLFPAYPIELNDNLKEIHCGDWELKKWCDIPPDDLDRWMKEFVTVPFPNGESYQQIYQRVTDQFKKIIHCHNKPIAIVSHGGVIRSILSYITNTPLELSFNCFVLPYGCVVKLTGSEGGWDYQVSF